MIDSVLKGTGNSRFLKSAVPAGTSWADALAMLQAGTFPIDFNGINAEGFQQVGTPLNKANLLKDATAAQIGLPPSTTPDGMFQALGNTGELHVWRKTVVTSQEIPAGYKLGSVQTGAFTLVSSNYITYEYGTPTISDDGTVGLSVVGTMNVNYQSNLNDLKGKFCRTTASGGTSFPDGQVIFIPGDAVFSTVGVTKETNKYQPVTGYAKVPAGTTTTYPVSTNPNAYQEGSNANTIIEYLGKLGNKARVQVVSYVGTGTHGISNPNSLTFDFVPKMLFVVGDYDSDSPGFLFATVQASYIHYPYSSQSRRPIFPFWNKTVKWYYDGAESQLNLSGKVYDGIAIG